MKSVKYQYFYTIILVILLLTSIAKNISYNRETNAMSHEIIKTPIFNLQKSIPQLCIITRTYEEQYAYLLTHLLSISHNLVSKPIVLLLITDGKSSHKKANEIANQANSIVGYTMTLLLPIKANDAQKISQNYKQDFGYSYTDASLDYLNLNKGDYPCDYFTFTNGDNLYSKGFIDDYILKDMNESIDIVGFDFVSRYVVGEVYDGREVFDDGSRKYKECMFQIGAIDLGAFVIKANLIWEDKELRFVSSCLQSGKEIKLADGIFIERATNKNVKRRLHRQILFVHQ